MGTLRAWLLLVMVSGAFCSPAQDAAFTYQGRLGADGAPFEGSCDLQFQAWDALVAGNPVGPIVTNVAVPVHQGVFTVALDLGVATFNGQPRWLEIGVRASGATAFTILYPRQPISPAPYALYALNAGGGGVIQPGSIASNALSQSTWQAISNALPSGGMSDAGLDNGAWYRLQSGNFGSGYVNYNRFGWTHTLARLRGHQQLRVQIDGGGLLDWPNLMLQPIVQKYLPSMLPIAGSLNLWPVAISPTNTYANGSKDTNWFAFYVATTAVGGAVRWWPGLSCDTFQIGFIASPDGGEFKVQTNLNDGPMTDYGTFSAYSPNRKGVVVRWTNSAPGNVNFQVVATTPGYIPFVNSGAWNSTISNGFIYGGNVAPSASFTNYLNPGTNVLGPIYQSLAPDLYIWSLPSGIEPMTNSPWASITNMCEFWRSLTNSDIVYAADYPFVHEVLTPWHDNPQAGNLFAREVCRAYGFSYFDGHSAFGSYSNMVARGFAGADGVHATRAGFDRYAAFLWDWLQLDQAR